MIYTLAVKSYAKYVLRQATDLILPPHTLPGLVGPGAKNPAEIWSKIDFLDEPCCMQCGFPFAFAVPAHSQCGECVARPPHYNRARSAFIYAPESRSLILAFKHGGYMEGVPLFAQHMQRAGRLFWQDADLLIPVPLHPKRLIKRRFNQSAILARALGKRVNVQTHTDALIRHRATESQGLMSAKGRYRNVRGAFSVPDHYKAQISGKHIVIVDDVMTTGATLSACAKTLKRNGASYIDVITLARTVKEERPHG